jgi:hypothetical protein
MQFHMTRDEFEAAIIAQDDDKDYSESGWVAWVIGDKAYLGRYSHCSCFDTFDALCGGGISDHFDEGAVICDWHGTVAELIDLAIRRADPAFPTRAANERDYDWDHLLAVYSQVLEWNRKRVPAE